MALTQVSSKGIKDATLLNEDVNASANIAGSKLADNSISLAKLLHGDSNNNGKFLRANNGADPSFESIPAGTTINNNADNRVITGGSGTTLNGEANLTFDGGTLVSKGDNGITIEATSTNTAGQLTIIGVNNNNNVSAITRIKSVSTDSSSAATATTFSNRNSSNAVNEHMRIDSSGKVGIGLTNPVNNLDVSGSLSATGNMLNTAYADGIYIGTSSGLPAITAGKASNSAYAPLVFRQDHQAAGKECMRIDDNAVLRIGNTHDQTTSGNTKRIALGAKGSIWGWASGQINGALTLADNYYWDGSNNKAIENDYSAYLTLRSGNLRFGTTNQTHSAGGNITSGIHEKFRIETNGNATINDGNLVIGTSGHGIDFSATSNASGMSSELFDDYEEGTWTPVANISGVSSVSGVECYYTKVGRMVHITARFTMGSGGSSNLTIGGLPFTSKINNQISTCVMHNGFDEGGSQEPVLMVYFGSSTTNMEWYYTRTNGANWVRVIGTEAQNHEVIFTLSYVAA